VSSAITFSGFNDIDFNVVLNAIMQQESQPLTALQSQQTALKSRVANLNTLAGMVTTLQDAAAKLASPTAGTAFTSTVSDPAAVAVSAGSSAMPGRYDVVVNELARAQVTASASTAPDVDTTIVASSGAITIGGHTVVLSGPVTLRQLADAINASADPPARASVVQSGPGEFRLVITSKNTGEENGFTIETALTGGIGVTFTDTDGNGVSGDSAEDNAVQASNAQILVNNIAVTSASNTIEGAIPGASITLFRRDPGTAIAVDVAPDASVFESKIEDFVDAYNDLVNFANAQMKSAGEGEQGSIGRDPLLRQLRSTLRNALTTAYGNTGPFQYVSEMGLELTQSGTLELNKARFTEAVASGAVDVTALFAGTTDSPGALASVQSLLGQYTGSEGLLPGARTQLNARVDRIEDQVIAMQERLAVRRLALQREFIAADQAMSLLKSQSASLAGFGSAL
jgi:flagellar hook-associated protein 2